MCHGGGEGPERSLVWCCAVCILSELGCCSYVLVRLTHRVVGVCSHVAGSVSLVCVHAKAEGHCSETHQAGHRIGCGVPFLTHLLIPGGGQAEHQPEVSKMCKNVPGYCKCLPLNSWKIIYKQEVMKLQRALLKCKRQHQMHFTAGKREAGLFSGCQKSPRESQRLNEKSGLCCLTGSYFSKVDDACSNRQWPLTDKKYLMEFQNTTEFFATDEIRACVTNWEMSMK